jgi:hypothetical protein
VYSPETGTKTGLPGELYKYLPLVELTCLYVLEATRDSQVVVKLCATIYKLACFKCLQAAWPAVFASEMLNGAGALLSMFAVMAAGCVWG